MGGKQAECHWCKEWSPGNEVSEEKAGTLNTNEQETSDWAVEEKIEIRKDMIIRIMICDFKI